MPAKSQARKAEPREVPTFVVIIAIVLIVLGLGAGGYYAYNGGWKTAGQQQEAYKHEFLPIMAAKHGDTAALEQENKLRAQQGRPSLEMPRDRKQLPTDYQQQMQELRQKLAGHQGQPAGQ